MIHLLSLTHTKQILICFHYITIKKPVPWHLMRDLNFHVQQSCHVILGYNLTKKKSEYFPHLPQTNLLSVI